MHEMGSLCASLSTQRPSTGGGQRQPLLSASSAGETAPAFLPNLDLNVTPKRQAARKPPHFERRFHDGLPQAETPLSTIRNAKSQEVELAGKLRKSSEQGAPVRLAAVPGQFRSWGLWPLHCPQNAPGESQPTNSFFWKVVRIVVQCSLAQTYLIRPRSSVWLQGLIIPIYRNFYSNVSYSSLQPSSGSQESFVGSLVEATKVPPVPLRWPTSHRSMRYQRGQLRITMNMIMNKNKCINESMNILVWAQGARCTAT